MSSYLTFYLVPKKTKTHYKEDETSEEIEVSKGEPLALMSFSRNSNIYQSFYEYLHPVYIGNNEPKYDELDVKDIDIIIERLRDELDESRKLHQNKIKVLKELGTSLDRDTLNQLIEEEDIIAEKEADLNEIIWLKSFFSNIKYSDFDKILMNID